MSRRQGLTIVELVSVLTLFAFVAAGSVRAYFLQPEITLENAATLLAHDLRAAQNRSAYLGETSTFRFFEDGDGYVVSNEAGETVRNPRTDRAFERQYSCDGVFDGIYVIEVEPVLRRIVYDGRGEATEGLKVTLAFGEERRRVIVEERTGRVVIEGSSSGWVDPGY